MTSRGKALEELFLSKVVVLDGAMGTAIQSRKLTAADFGGADLDGCNENLVVTRPDVIRDIHAAYLEAGADAVETNSFGGTPLVLAEYGLAHRAIEINQAAARVAREAAATFRDRFVLGSVGPTTKAITVTGGVTFPELIDAFRVQSLGLLQGGVDGLLVETCQDTRNIKAALLGVRAAFREFGARVPILVSATIEPMGTMLAGQGVDALYASLEDAGVFSIGLNCGTGPEFMTDHIRTLASMSRARVTCYPNAGLPDASGTYNESPKQMARVVGRFLDHGWLNLVGGCCGTTHEHVRELARAAKDAKPRVPAAERRTHFSGIEYVSIDETNRPLIVGERTNVIGSRKFKKLISDERFEEAAEIARRQVKAGAHILDVCLSNPDRDEISDVRKFLEKAIRMVKVPLMIDTTDALVLEEALTWCQGKSIINSINLEHGEERFELVVPIAKRYGAALVVGCIDDDPVQAQAITVERKLEIAERSFGLLTKKYGVPKEDLIWDPLVFPCATGDKNYVGSADQTIRGVRALKERFPGTRTILGISNVSFGLPEAGREVLNAVFLYHCTKAGLDLAIVSSEKLVRYGSIPEEEKRLADDLLFNRGADPIAAFAAHYRGRPKERITKEKLPLDERLARYIVEGTKDGLVEDLKVKLKEARPLEIINGPLMKGMDEVGRLFNNNELIVAEVLQSAEAMKAAVGFLEPFMEKTETSTKGKVLLATVKGDVHDIGKNLVDIILSNNGYKVINLGIKVPPERLIAAAREHRPDMIGLSGLLVKSAQQMVATVEDFRSEGIDLPILVGGAALTRKFTYTRIRPAYGKLVAYAKDAMTGLALAHQVMQNRAALEAQVADEASKLAASDAPSVALEIAAPTTRSKLIRADEPIRLPPDFERHTIEVPPKFLWPYVNRQFLYAKHLGLKGAVERLRQQDDPKLREVEEAVREVEKLCESGWMKPRGVWRFFHATSEGNRLFVENTRFDFPRQPKEDGMCLADFVRPVGRDADAVAMFVVTTGEGIRERATELKDRGEYVRSHALQALALEAAEGFAELLHQRLRELWGFPDAPGMTMVQRFKADYQGVRVSFGYPACPNLADQEKLFALLRPDDIGVQLTEGHMMDPEASVSALVFHHTQATYFNASAE